MIKVSAPMSATARWCWLLGICGAAFGTVAFFTWPLIQESRLLAESLLVGGRFTIKPIDNPSEVAHHDFPGSHRAAEFTFGRDYRGVLSSIAVDDEDVEYWLDIYQGEEDEPTKSMPMPTKQDVTALSHEFRYAP